MIKTLSLLFSVLGMAMAFGQETTAFKVQKNNDVLMDMVIAFPHELKNTGITDGYMNDEVQGTYYSLVNPRQGDQSLDQYAVLKKAQKGVFLVQATWNIEIIYLSENTSQIKIKIESALNNDNRALSAQTIKSTGLFESELKQFLDSDFQVEKDTYDVQDSTATATSDFYDYTETSQQWVEPHKIASVNLQKLIKNGKIIPFPLQADYFTKKLGQQPVTHDFEAAVNGKYYSWNVDESIGLLYLKKKDGLEYYSFYALDDSVVTGLPLNLEMNYSSLEGCLFEFKGYLPQWTQVVEENGDTFFQIEFKTKESFVHLEFDSESKNLKTVLIANRSLN